MLKNLCLKRIHQKIQKIYQLIIKNIVCVNDSRCRILINQNSKKYVETNWKKKKGEGGGGVREAITQIAAILDCWCLGHMV